MILLSPYLIAAFLVEAVIVTLGFVALFWALKIALEFDRNKVDEAQYKLATKGYLVATIIMFILVVKLPLFLYFVWTMDTLSDIVPGAMCAAGIVSATDYGTGMLGLKIVNLFLLCGWILVHKIDMRKIDSKFLTLKFFLYQPLFLLLAVEFILELTHFSKMSITTPVACCSVIFSQNNLFMRPFYQTHSFILALFFGSFALYLLAGFFKKPILFGGLSVGFALSAIYALIRFFSPYVYELPTHMCPFCLLQKEYFYVGYLIYILLFFGILFGFSVVVLSFLKESIPRKYYSLGMIANTLLVLILCAYPIVYYIRNGVWL